MSKPIVIKIGTSTLTGRNPGEPINIELVSKLAKTICDFEKQYKRKCILVSSGAMGLGIAKLGLQDKLDVYKGKLDMKASITAIGQVQLMNVYEGAFLHQCKKHVGQILITDHALKEPGRQKRVKKTIENLFELDVLPIFNENDTVCPDEIEYGDNDKLSAHVAVLAGAERLIILTDTDGLFDADPHSNPHAKLIENISEITEDIKSIAGDSSTHGGLGGMKTKVHAAEICMQNGIVMNIINKERVEEISNFVNGKEKPRGTEFKA